MAACGQHWPIVIQEPLTLLSSSEASPAGHIMIWSKCSSGPVLFGGRFRHIMHNMVTYLKYLSLSCISVLYFNIVRFRYHSSTSCSLRFTAPPTAGTAPRHGRVPDTSLPVAFKNECCPGPIWSVVVKARAPLRISASLLSFWSKRRGQQETYYSLYGLCLGVRLPCCLGPQKRVLLQRRGPYMVITARDWSLLAERQRERERDGGGNTLKKWMLSIKHWLNDWVIASEH